MTQNDYNQRFDGARRLYGDQVYAMLRDWHFCVIGIGGVGSWAVEALARGGIGKLTLIDYDTIAVSNINRQLHTLDSTLDLKKAQVMANRVREINPDCDVTVIDDFINMQNMEEYLSRRYDYVIDAIDSIKFKAAMLAYCKRNRINIITTGGAGGLNDPTHIQIKDLSKTFNDPLAAKVRSKLREEYGFTRNSKRSFGIDCVFSSQQPLYPKEDGTVSHQKPGIHGVSLDCRFGYGTTMTLTATFGFFAAQQAINRLIRKKTTVLKNDEIG